MQAACYLYQRQLWLFHYLWPQRCWCLRTTYHRLLPTQRQRSRLQCCSPQVQASAHTRRSPASATWKNSGKNLSQIHCRCTGNQNPYGMETCTDSSTGADIGKRTDNDYCRHIRSGQGYYRQSVCRRSKTCSIVLSRMECQRSWRTFSWSLPCRTPIGRWRETAWMYYLCPV